MSNNKMNLNESTSEEIKQYRKEKFEEYSNCNHIIIHSKKEGDKPSTYRCCGCIKCGLDTDVLNKKRENLSMDEIIKYDCLKKNHLCFHGIYTEIVCDLELAQAMYSKILEVYPDIDDAKAVKYFGIALDDIRNIGVNQERKESRARRLSLDQDFDRWNE